MGSRASGAGPRHSLTFRFRGERSRSLRSRRARRCSIGCARRRGPRGRRKAAARAIAAPARSCCRASATARSTYEPVNACILLLGPGRRRGSADDRGSRRRRRAAPGSAGDGRFSRLAMRLLHAGHRHEPVRALSRAPSRDLRRASARRWREISAAAPATSRSSTPRWRPARASRPTASRRERPSAARRWRRSSTGATSSSATRAPSSPRPRARRRSPISTRATRKRSCSAGRPTSACGSPSSCAIPGRSSGSAASRGSTRSRRAPTGCASARARRWRARRRI